MLRNASAGRSVRAIVFNPDVFLEHLAVLDGEARCRQRIDHFIGEQHAIPFAGHGTVRPVHQLEQGRWQILLQALALALAQVGAGFEDQVAVGQCVEFEQALEHDFGEGPTAAAQLQE